MGSKTVRKRKDGSVVYNAQVRIMHKGVTVYQESQTFDRKATAQAWIKRVETEMAVPGAIEKANRSGITVKEMIQKLVEYADGRIRNDGIQAQTVGNDLAHIGAVLAVARPAWGYDIDPMAMSDARKVLRKMGAVTRSKERVRRPTLEELNKLFEYFSQRLGLGTNNKDRPRRKVALKTCSVRGCIGCFPGIHKLNIGLVISIQQHGGIKVMATFTD